MIVAVDPGKREAGVALFDDGELAAAWLSRGDGWFETARAVYDDVFRRIPGAHLIRTVVIERPQVYRQRQLKGDPNDLVDVALCAGAVAAEICSRPPPAPEIVTYLPGTWKKQVPKRIKNKRDVAKLSDEENARVEWPRSAENKTHVADAIGLGLFHIKRRTP